MGAMTLISVVQDPNAIDDSPQLISGGNNVPGSDNLKKLDETTLTTIRDLPNVVDATPIGGGVWVKTARLEGQDKKMWPNLIAFDPSTDVFELPLLAGRQLDSADLDKIVVGKRFLSNYQSISQNSLV
jgi:hypothetical protein